MKDENGLSCCSPLGRISRYGLVRIGVSLWLRFVISKDLKHSWCIPAASFLESICEVDDATKDLVLPSRTLTLWSHKVN